MTKKNNMHSVSRLEIHRFRRPSTETNLVVSAALRGHLVLLALAALAWGSVPCGASAAPAVTYVQGNYATPQSAQTSVSVKFSAAQKSGDLNVVVVGWNDSTATVSSVTDSSGNTYQRAVGPTVVSGLLSQSIYYAKKIVAAGAGLNTVTVRFSTAAAFPDVRILEYSGADPTNPVDVTAADNGTGLTSSSGVARTTTPTDLLFGANIVTSLTSGPGGGFTARLLTSPDGDIAQDRMVTATGSYSVSAPVSQGRWIMQMVAFRTAAPADAQPPTPPGNLTATATGSTQINLSWAASSDNLGVTGYVIERCQGSGCTSSTQTQASRGAVRASLWVNVGTPTGTAFGDTGLKPSTSYTYRARATDAAGNLSAYSNAATAVTRTTVPGLVAAYSFDEGAGTTVTDLSGNGNTGTVSNTSWTNLGKYGNALVFNGVSSRVTINDAASLHLTTGMTLEAWVNPSTVTSAWRDVIYKGGTDNYFLEAASNSGGVPAGGATVGDADTALLGRTSLSANTWTHLAVTYDGTALHLYVNGVQVSTRGITGNILTSTTPLQIGSDSVWGQYFAGVIDEVRVYNVALNQSQIQSDMTIPVGAGGSTPIVSLSPTSLSFGSVATGSSSGQQATTLSNVGGAQLSISSIRISAGNAGDFTQTNNCGAGLAPGAACTINATFVPTTTGTRASSIVVTDNAPGGTHTVPLSGTGTGFAVTPRVVALTFTQPQQFTATGSVTWSVDGIVGGTASTGTITAAGLYTPPSVVGTHTVTAKGAQSASATVYVTNHPGTFTFHNDNFRSGVNSGETVLTPALVNPAQFGKLFSYPIDGWAFASPLYVANVNIPGQGLHNVVFVATEHDSVYAFDADGRSASPLWHVSFLGQGVTTVPCADVGECGDIPNEIGISSTPVIDQGTGTLYVVAKTKEGNTYMQRLHALDIATGAEKFGGPVVIQASVTGNGAGANGNNLAFDPLRENQRAGLLLSGGVVYLAFAAHGDQPPYHGWVIGYNASTLQRTMAWCESPNGYGGGIWQSGSGLAADASGAIFFTTGNGDFNADTSGADFGDTVVKLGSSGTVVDYFTPYDQANMEQYDLDLASSGPVLLVDQPGPTPHRLVAAGKTGTIYVVNRDNMGHFQSGSDSQIIQSLPGVLPHGDLEEGNFSAPVFFNNNVYYGAVGDSLKIFQFTNGVLSSGPVSQSVETYPNRGASFAVSANGSTNGLLWAVQDNTPAGGVLRVYDASDLWKELYNSDSPGSRDTLDSATKFSIPLIANGKAFVVTQTQITAYGLLP